MIDEGNKSCGGLKRSALAFGIVGFMKFLDCYYLTLITQRKRIGRIGPNFIYGIKAVETFAIKPKGKKDKNPFVNMWNKMNKRLNQTTEDTAESRYFALYQSLDITKDFYFSYTYDLTNSFQVIRFQQKLSIVFLHTDSLLAADTTLLSPLPNTCFKLFNA